MTKIAVAAVAMGGLVWLTSAAIQRLFRPESLLEQAFALLVPVLIGVATYLGMALALRVEELALVKGIVARRRNQG